ncbi:ATP-binding protein, partial [Candidatus Saccharibacteria bacterium]|nr:ATP-binding protein [Candidatus Saccharibacteria bacterium]
MIAKIHSMVPYGFEGKLVEVEGDMNRGLPTFNIVGMANKTINEAKERVRSAIVNSGFFFPDKKVTINLAPAELLKDGTYLDLPIALSVLLLSGQLIRSDIERKAFVGELSLNGEIKPVKGVINIVETAKKAGYQEIYLPIRNLAQASLVSGVAIHGVESLQNLYLALKSQLELPTANNVEMLIKQPRGGNTGPILDHICGQDLAKRAIEIAIAGHHNILISGPPGAGKTLLAKAAINLLPELTPQETVEITKL